MNEQFFEAMAQSIIEGEMEDAIALAKQSIEQDIDPLDAINKGFIVGVNQVGDAFSCGDAFLPELVMAGEAMKAAVDVLEPELARRGTKREIQGVVVLGTVEGDRSVNADIVAVSALLTTKMVKQRDVVKALADSGLDRIKIMVGGAPVTRSWMEEIGADGYSEDAIGAVSVAKELMLR